MSSLPTPSRLPRFGSNLPTLSASASVSKKRTVAALRNPEANKSFLSRFQKKPPPTPPKPATTLNRSFSVATRESQSPVDKPLPSPPVAQVLHQETGRTLIDASEVPMALSRPLSPTRQSAQSAQLAQPASDPVWDIPQPPASTPDRSLQRRPSYHELKRRASEFIGLKVPAEDTVPSVPPIPAEFSSGTPAKVSTIVETKEPSTPTPVPRSRLTAPNPVPRPRVRHSSGSPETAKPGSFKSTNSKTKGSGLGRPAGPPRSAGEAPPRAVLKEVSSSTRVVVQAAAHQPRTSSLPLPQPTPATSSVQSRRNPLGCGRIPSVPIRTPYSVADNINAAKPSAPAHALAHTTPYPSGPLPPIPTTVKSPTSSGPVAKDVAPVAVDDISSAPTPLVTPTRPYASPRHASKASQASQKSHAAKMLAGAPSTIAPGSSRASSGFHEDTLPKTPSPLRDALTLESDEEPEALQATVSQLATSSCIEQSYAEFLRSIPVEQHAEVQAVMTKIQVACAHRQEMEKLAHEAERSAKALRLRADSAQQTYAGLNLQMNELLGLYVKK
ncbi:hypothetical protein EG328_008544 [Venturia inaequalis]|uniref:Uncharacterized protein n=1 Tax=Venturia inaequalis TaxID=5025 RepID=A0A8H3UAH4_VENIN|nr:hypothetical protein EG328_008544 [Venturia inaequalis]